MIDKILGYLLRFFHAILILGLWLSPFYLTDSILLLFAIVLQAGILAQLRFMEDRCILTIIEEKLTGEKIAYHKGKSMAGFNGVLAKWIGIDGMLTINSYTPFFVIIADALKVGYNITKSV